MKSKVNTVKYLKNGFEVRELSLLKKLEDKVEKKVMERVTPILDEMRKVYKELVKVNKNLEEAGIQQAARY